MVPCHAESRESKDELSTPLHRRCFNQRDTHRRTEQQKMSAVAGGAHSLHNVFVYGSLMADDVVRALLKRVPHSSPAILNDLSVVSLSYSYICDCLGKD